MEASCQSRRHSYMEQLEAELTPSERSVTRLLTTTSRPLTLAFSLDSTTAISYHALYRFLGMDKPFGECFLLNGYPLLLPSHLHKFIGFGVDKA